MKRLKGIVPFKEERRKEMEKDLRILKKIEKSITLLAVAAVFAVLASLPLA